MSLSILTSAVVAASVLSGLSGVSAQITANIQCSSSYAWAFNSRQQSPCLVAAHLEGACNGGVFSISSLTPSDYYTGPTDLSANPCQCSSIVYSLISACADCQGRTYIGWREWNQKCPSPYLRLFPVDIPSGTSVPSWAYLDVGTSDRYNPVLAKAASNAPESSASLFGTSTRGITGTATGGAKSTGASSGGTNVGAIAGGVVGGVLFLGAIVGIGAFIFLRRRRAKIATPAAYDPAYNADGYPTQPPSTKEYSYSPSAFSPASSNMATTPGVLPKLYDPADPSTYPTASASPTLHTTDSLPYHDSNYGAHLAPPPRGAYSGAPEI